MVVDQRTLKANMLRSKIWANVFNKLTWQQAQTQQTTPTVQQTTDTPITQSRWLQQTTQQQPEVYKVITNKFPTYDIKDLMWFWPQAVKNQLWFANTVSQYNRLQAQADANTDPNVRYNLTKPELTNKQTLQIQQATPETNEQWLKINKTNSFKDLVIDLQNVANQWRNLEFMKFRELYPEYVENWDKVVDLFESIKANPQYSAEQVTNTAQKAYPELFGINENYSDKDKTAALQRLYDEMVSNKQNWIQLTQQDIIDRYPEYANTEDINTVMEVQELINKNKKTPTFNDIVANFDSMTKWNVEVWNTEKEQFKKDLKSIDNIFQSTYNWLSDEWKDYVKLLSIAKAVWDTVRQEYWIPESISDRDILQQLKQSDPEYYNELVWDIDSNTTLSEQDRKLLDNNWTLKSAWQSLWRSIVAQWVDQVIQLWKWLLTKIENWELLKWNKVLNTNPLTWEEYENGDIFGYQKMINNNENLSKLSEKVDTAWKKFLWDLQTELWWMEEDFKNTDMYKKFESESWKKIKTAIKDWDWWAVANNMWWVIGQTLPALVVWYLTKWKWFTTQKLAEFSAFALPSYQRAMEDIESDESLSWLTAKEKDELATRMATIESVIETASLSNMFPWLSEWGGIISKIPWMKNVLLRTLVQTQIWAAWESLEEVTQEFFNNLLAKNAWSDRGMWELKDYWDIFTETYLSSQLISALWWATEWINQAQINSLQKQITEQADLRNKVLEWQAIMANDFNEFANAVEVVPWTTTEELQQVWNNTQQKKQELEEKANRITSNSYSNVATPTYQRATVKDTVNPKITANESQQYTDLLDEMIKNKEISEEDRKRVEKTLWVFTLNNKSLVQQQWEKQLESQQPTWLSNLTDKTENNNTNNNRKIKAGVWTRMLQNYNRMNPKRVRKFEAQFGKTYWQWMEERWFTKAWESNVNDIMDYSKQMQKIKTDIIKKIAWDYRNIAVSDMLSYANERATDTLDRENIEWLQPLLDKYLAWKWLTFQEIEKMRKYFSNNINLPYYEDTDAKTAQKNMNIYTALQKYVEKIATENGFDRLKEINSEISASESIARWVIEKILWWDVNNTLWLTDWITIASAVSAWSPWAIATVLTKNALKNEKVRNAILKIAVWKRDNAKFRWVKVDLDNISKIADEKRRQQAIKEFNEKYWDLWIALPYKEWYNGTPTTTITVTPEWLSKTQWKVNTPNSEQKSQWLSKTQKNSETQDNVNEQVQDSIEDFLSDVWANETKQDLENATTANYKNMSKRWLEQLLKSDKIPAEEAKKITDELAMRNVKEDQDWWDYLDHKYAYEIQQLQEEEQRIGKVWNKKVNKTYAEEQMKTWETKKEKLKEDMKQAYWDKDNDRVEDKYSELEWKPIDFINEWKKSKRFAVDEAEQQVIAKLQENWNKIKRFELNMTEEEKKVREDILWKVSDLYETKSTDYGDSFVSRTNRDNRWIIYRDDGRVNVNSLDTLKSSGLYDVLPDDTKIAISWQEQTTLWELKKQPQGLAEVSLNKEQPKTEWLSTLHEDAEITWPDMSEENRIEMEINRIMTMEEASKIIEMAWNANNLRDFYDWEYNNAEEWIKGEWADEVWMYIENTFASQKMIESHPEILEWKYFISDVLENYLKWTLTGKVDEKAKWQIDLSKDTWYEWSKFYEPQRVKEWKDLWDKANQRVTKSNQNEIYRARADFIINSHTDWYIESLWLDQAEVNKKIMQWTAYPATAKALSERINKWVALENKWTWLENSSIVHKLSITDDELKTMVKEVKWNPQRYESKYIVWAMLALDTHIDWSNLSFDFNPDRSQQKREKNWRTITVAWDYDNFTNSIRVWEAWQNTVAHEMGHYLDYLRCRQLLWFNSTLSEWHSLEWKNLTEDQKAFINHFREFMKDLTFNADLRNEYTMTPTEVFARFVGRFTERVQNKATNWRYSYETKWYNDNYKESQFIEFANLLQEKWKLDIENNYPNYEKYLNNRKPSDKVWWQTIDDIKADAVTRWLADISIPPTKEYTVENWKVHENF